MQRGAKGGVGNSAFFGETIDTPVPLLTQICDSLNDLSFLHEFLRAFFFYFIHSGGNGIDDINRPILVDIMSE